MKFLYFALLSVLSLAVHVNGSEFYVGGWRNLVSTIVEHMNIRYENI